MINAMKHCVICSNDEAKPPASRHPWLQASLTAIRLKHASSVRLKTSQELILSWRCSQVSDWGSGEPADLDALQVTSFEANSGPERPFYEQLARRLAQLEASPHAHNTLQMGSGCMHSSLPSCLQVTSMVKEPSCKLLLISKNKPVHALLSATTSP